MLLECIVSNGLRPEWFKINNLVEHWQFNPEFLSSSTGIDTYDFRWKIPGRVISL